MASHGSSLALCWKLTKLSCTFVIYLLIHSQFICIVKLRCRLNWPLNLHFTAPPCDCTRVEDVGRGTADLVPLVLQPLAGPLLGGIVAQSARHPTQEANTCLGTLSQQG